MMKLSKYPIVECEYQPFSDEPARAERYHPEISHLTLFLNSLHDNKRTNIRVVYEFEERDE